MKHCFEFLNITGPLHTPSTPVLPFFLSPILQNDFVLQLVCCLYEGLGEDILLGRVGATALDLHEEFVKQWSESLKLVKTQLETA